MAIEEVAADLAAMTDVVATADLLVVNNANPGNSEKLVAKDLDMLTTDHLVI